ncbi:MAG TPA: hypothetical protein VMP08_25150 [Anaerolineae bacterium]|nr:hypothetical protein [Anaerolineae bacterium]
MGDPTDSANITNGGGSAVSGGVNLTSDQANIGGDVVGRDKVTQVQGDQINNYLQIDLAQLAATLKQALPANDPLPDRLVAALQDFKRYHSRLWEFKELHNTLNDVVFVLDQFAREVERLDATGQKGDARTLGRLWRPIGQKVDLLVEFARTIQHIGSPLVEANGSWHGPAWAIELRMAAQRVSDLLVTPANYDFAALYDATYAFSDAAEKHMYLADKQLRDTAGELFNQSNQLLGEFTP